MSAPEAHVRARRCRAQGGSRRNLSFYYGDFRALKDINMPVHEQQGHRADRPVGLRQVHLPALLQPHARPLSGQPLRRRDPSAPGQHQPAGDAASTRSRCACASAWCSRSPTRSRRSIFENVAYGLRVRGEALAPPPRGEGRAGAAGRCAVGRGQGPAARAGVQSFRRAAAAPVHRARARDRPGDPAVRRADLGARPDRHGLASRS